MAQLGHKRLEIEWEHRDQMTRDYGFDERVEVEDPKGETMKETKFSQYDDDMTYGDDVLNTERAARY